MPGKLLKPEKIAETAARLSKRIHERFPSSGLYHASRELMDLGERARVSAPNIARPIYTLRIGVGVLIAAIVAIVASMIMAGIDQMHQLSRASITEVVGALEAGTNELVLVGLGIFFLVNLESRIKRARALSDIHELRSIAHVIDMHQLTKDPAVHRKYFGATESSPARPITLPEMIRYFDYCSELLSLTSKIAALYIQRFNDGVVLSAVSDVESLCASLSAKIWQKLQIAESILADS
jgi:hypothetical protein